MGEVRESYADAGADRLSQTLVDIVVESWRFSRLFSRLLSRLDASEASRYVNQLRYYVKRLEDSLATAEIRLINLEGQSYDPGMAASALNMADFGPDDALVVDQMIEPVLMRGDGLLRSGTIMLRKLDA